jgi:rare lipoprotein A
MHQRLAPRCLGLLLLLRIGVASPALATERAKGEATLEREKPVARPKLDRSGRKGVGVASVYARRFTGRMMADGTLMDPRDDNASSKTLPLGTEPKVTHLETVWSANVTIHDHGPYVEGRIVGSIAGDRQADRYHSDRLAAARRGRATCKTAGASRRCMLPA